MNCRRRILQTKHQTIFSTRTGFPLIGVVTELLLGSQCPVEGRIDQLAYHIECCVHLVVAWSVELQQITRGGVAIIAHNLFGNNNVRRARMDHIWGWLEMTAHGQL
jgi:hypothetical protein